MQDLARRVITVTPDDVIGPTRRHRPRPIPRPNLTAVWWTLENDIPDVDFRVGAASPQQGFLHFDEIARGLKR